MDAGSSRITVKMLKASSDLQVRMVTVLIKEIHKRGQLQTTG